MSKDIIFYQLFESETSTYTYLIADRKSEAVPANLTCGVSPESRVFHP
jgi:hypothetical protein